MNKGRVSTKKRTGGGGGWGTNEGLRRLTTCIHVLVTASLARMRCASRYIGRRIA